MTRASVLLVDDRVAVRLTLQSILSDYGCDFVEAADGEAALALMATTPFDVIFLDLKLPDLSGIEILRRARERGDRLGRVIVLTGFLEPAAKDETEKLGAFRHLTKDPINHDDVRDAFIAAIADGGPAPTPPTREPDAERASHIPLPRARTRPAAGRRRDLRPRVLVLDDQEHWLHTIGLVLGDEFALTPTADPEEACKQTQRAHFDVVILDMKLSGGITGLDVLTRMAETTPGLKVIILTGEPGDGYDAAVESILRGASMFVVKSELATLPDKVRQMLSEPTVSPSVFLSYDRRDQRRVKRLYQRLKKHGMRPWMDTEDLVAGTEWDPSIESRIRESDHFVFCYSHHSWNKEGAIRKELNLAIQRLPELREGRHYLIVARLDRTDVAGSLRRFHYVDLFQRGGFEKLLRAISADGMPRM